jgi:hypothetical protein
LELEEEAVDLNADDQGGEWEDQEEGFVLMEHCLRSVGGRDTARGLRVPRDMYTAFGQKLGKNKSGNY